MSSRSKARGFSLVELAVVLMIVGTLLAGVLTAVSQSAASARITNTRAQLRQIEEALYGFAQTYGRLPCPATATSGGQEDPAGGGPCTRNHGFVPGNTIGIYGQTNADGLLVDAWQNPIRYSVADYESSAFTTTGLNALFGNSTALEAMPDDADMLRVCNTSACTDDVFTDAAPAVLLSMGPNWATYDSADEIQNAGDGTTSLAGSATSYNVTDTNDFVTRSFVEDEFDDQLVWLSPYVLFNRLISAGKLP